MKDLVKYIIIVGLMCLAYCHTRDWTTFTMALYFGVEYFLLMTIFIYLAIISKGIDKAFFLILSPYFGLKLIYNTLLYIEPVNRKFELYNSELWGFIITVIIVVSLICIQISYAKKR